MAHPFHEPAETPPHDLPTLGAEPMQASSPISARTPFVAEVRRRSVSRSGSFEGRYFEGGHFVPSASLVLTPALRAGGLWHALPGEEIKTLLLVLTFLTPDGACRPTLAELAPAMRLPAGKARARLERLAACRWQGAPVLHELRRDSGLHAFIPAPGVLRAVEAPPQPQETSHELQEPRAAGREAVIAHSRALYARPRAEVEREMAVRMGWEDPEALRQEREREEAALTDGQKDLLARLLGLGVERTKALELLSGHSPETIRRQVAWLPLRGAKNPARFLVAAVAGDYAPPAGWHPLPSRRGTQGEEAAGEEAAGEEAAGRDAVKRAAELSPDVRETQPPEEDQRDKEKRTVGGKPGQEDMPAPHLERLPDVGVLPDVGGLPDEEPLDVGLNMGIDMGRVLTLPASEPVDAERHST